MCKLIGGGEIIIEHMEQLRIGDLDMRCMPPVPTSLQDSVSQHGLGPTINNKGAIIPPVFNNFFLSFEFLRILNRQLTSRTISQAV